MEVTQKREIGTLNISEAVIEKIARLVVNEVEGVARLTPAPLTWKDVLFSSAGKKAIRLQVEAGVAEMDVYVILKAGYRIKDVAEHIQEYVKNAVQNMAAVTVSKVNVHVQGVETKTKA
ncbi:MAG: Asp23/Gls24 family envelope stress response protein [Massiliimalia sp.]|jgi:uncharacterized alkaline shock family protein YloU